MTSIPRHSLFLLLLWGTTAAQDSPQPPFFSGQGPEQQTGTTSRQLLLDLPAEAGFIDSCLSHEWHLRESFPYFRKEVKTGAAPKSCCFSPGGHILAVCLLSEDGVDLYDAGTLKRIRRISPSSAGDEDAYVRQEYFWGYAEGRFLDATGEFWFTRMTTGRFHVYQPDTGTIQTYDAGGSWTKVVSFSPDRSRVAFSHWLSNTVTIFDTPSRRLLRTIPTGTEPRGLAWLDRQTIAVALYGGGTVQIFDSETGTLVSAIVPDSGHSARDICFDPRTRMIYFSDMGRAAVRKYSWDSRKCEAAAAVDQKPNSIGLTPGGEYLFVSCRGPNNPEGYTLRSPRNGSLYLIRTEDFSILKTWTAGNQPTGLAISPDGRMLASTDFQDRRLNLYLIAR